MVRSCPPSSSSFTFSDDVYWYCKRDIKIGSVKCIAHVYLDKMRKSQQETFLLSKISEFENIFFQKKFQSKSECDEYVSEALKSWKYFFIVKKSKEGFSLERNVLNIEKEIERMGSIILLTCEDTTMLKDEILGLYRNKDSIEKVFSSLKNNLNEKRNRTHSLMTMRGSIFINFTSLILISWIDHIMKEKKLYKKQQRLRSIRFLID